MRISETNIRYLHPVLAEHSGDYNVFDLKADFASPLIEGDNVVISSNIEINSTYLEKKIASGEMGLGYYLVCQDTMLNQLFKIETGKHVERVAHSKLFGKVEIRPVVFTNTLISNTRDRSINAEFGDEITFEPASLTMICSKVQFNIEPAKFQPFGALFQLAKDDSLQPGKIEVDAEGDKIRILAEGVTYLKLLDMRNTRQTRNLLMNAVYLPAVMETLYAMRSFDEGVAQCSWYDVVMSKCNALDINPLSDKETVYSIAQSLMSLPVERIFDFQEEEKL